MANENLIRQIDACPLGGSISVVLSNIFCIKMEHDISSLLKPNLYKRYVDDVFSKQVKNQPDKLSDC